MPISNSPNYVSRDDETEAALIAEHQIQPGQTLVVDIDELKQYHADQYGFGFPPVDGSGDFR